jgi:HSP20 family protein
MSAFTNAVNELLRLQGQLDARLRSPRSEFFFGPSTAGVFPSLNVFRDRKGDVVIRAELPGVNPEDINVTVEQRRLTISGERRPEGPDNGYHRRERPFGQFSRSLQLPPDLDVERAEARFSNGVMTLRVPLAAAARPRQINVQVA